jgi:hypothetical protein
MRLEYRKITEDEWNRLPTKPGREPDEIDRLLDDVEQGKIVQLDVPDDKLLRGMRVSLSRRARRRGFKLDIRTQDHSIAVRKREQAPPPPPQAPAMRRGRRRKVAEEEMPE